MARDAEPWRWEERGGWYAWVRGSRRRLAPFKDGKRAATRRLNELLEEAERGAGAGDHTVGELVLMYLRALGQRREDGEVERQTKDDAARRLAGFGEAYGDLPSDEVKPLHVQAWLDSRKGWGATSRHDGVGAVKAVFRWALQQGHVGRDPLAGLKKPQRKGRREEIPTPAVVAAVFAAALSPELTEILAFIQDTGCRPKEARTLEAVNLEPAHGIAVLSKHKTGKKTGKKRVLYLQGRAGAIAGRLALARPEGPIFLNTKGRPWTKDALTSAVSRAKARIAAGAAKHGQPPPDLKAFVAYALRHLYITDGAAKGIPAPILAELAGHADLRMISTYSHISDRHELLGDAAAKIAGGGD